MCCLLSLTYFPAPSTIVDLKLSLNEYLTAIMAFKGAMSKDIALGQLVAEFITKCFYLYMYMKYSSKVMKKISNIQISSGSTNQGFGNFCRHSIKT